MGPAASAVPLTPLTLSAASPDDYRAWLSQEIIGPQLALEEVQAYTESRVPLLPLFEDADEWREHARSLREAAHKQVLFRGEAARWRDAELRIDWQETIDGGPGYHIKKLRYEALPGLWIPALLYEPDNLQGKVPVSLNVNGHEGEGKAVHNKQIRCINQAKRGILTLSPDWFGMGQLRTADFAHGRLNQIDLCGTSGVGTFYLALKRGLDVLLAHEHADSDRVAVSGLSGGGWQTIFLSAFDTRVTLANPVAGYSSFRTRARNFMDLGDSEQTPVDLGAVADYAQMTAMLAPRATLLTYNAADDCCFRAGHALPPLLEAAEPIFKLLGQEDRLRSHVNYNPGNHNFDRDNREALYRMIRDVFYGGSPDFDPLEINVDQELKTADELRVELPEDNLDLHRLAVELSRDLPRQPSLPDRREALLTWQEENRDKLRAVLRLPEEPAEIDAEKHGQRQAEGVQARFWRLRLDHAWTIPCVELSPGEAKGTVILVADQGRAGAAEAALELVAAGQRVLAIDPFYVGESKLASHDYLFALMLSTVGDRPLGLQARQIAAVCDWAREQFDAQNVTVTAIGPRMSVAALCAAAVAPESIGGLDLWQAPGSLKEPIEKNLLVNEAPELFCFGLLQQFEMLHLAALSAPRPVRFHAPSDRVREELATLPQLYKLLGGQHDPLGE